ncbi:MAG TPA: formate acetyltransferase [Candidatus Bilophila faecipullorum]|uniref:Formate acetyltransferase n=1 Tax=Candidatus Bilophila faecipullorum TaxID=2838482 RepID=A0A9D1QYX7_9BACT|nr:pyruvate formate lyase family protein [uncultured Bilophila sp.]HIW78483.1 formate acetyltransferase [Candidatus Bilophila faecipullorum]
MFPRIDFLRRQFFANRPSVCLEAALAKTRIFRETEGEALILRRAKSFRETCRTKTVTIQPQELIVGNAGARARQACITPELSNNWFVRELDTMRDRPQDPYDITEAQKAQYREEIYPYWRGKSLRDIWEKQVPADTMALIRVGGVVDCGVKVESAPSELNPNFRDHLFVKGYAGIRREAETALAALDLSDVRNLERRDFWQAAAIACEGMETLAARYADEAERLAAKEADAARAAELRGIAESCRRLAGGPPLTFRDALQQVYFTLCGLFIEGNGGGYSIGRLDQYLYPFYLREREAGLLSDEAAQELLECLWIKLGEQLWYQTEESARDYAGYCPFHNLCVGGVDADGNDAVNPLSYMMLDATIHVRMAQPSLSVRLSCKNPEEFFLKVAECVQTGTGFPAIHSDEVGTMMVMRKGVPSRVARDWALHGCVEPDVPGMTSQWTSGGHYNLASAIEFALTQGVHLKTGEQVGLRTPDPASFRTFDDFRKAVYAQLGHIIRHFSIVMSLFERLHLEHLPLPLASLVTLDCVEKGKHLMQGGARYNWGPGMNTNGFGDFIDSMAAVRKLVFQEGKLSMSRLVEAIRADFEGCADVRRLLLEEAPKWGNDDDDADAFAGELTAFLSETFGKTRGLLGNPRMMTVIPITSNIPQGASVSALPSGRRAGSPLADGISACQGRDRKGPTALLKSMSKFPHVDYDGGLLLNVRFTPASVAGEEGRFRLVSFLRTFLDLGLFHIQFNIVGQEVLRCAQERPDDHRSLLVRVAGYSAYFVELSKEMQEDIISRIPHEL